MSQLVDPAEIERIVGHERHPSLHLGRAVSSERTVYILHSANCLANTIDLRTCGFSLALDRGIDVDDWIEDEPVVLWIDGHGSLRCRSI